MSVPDISRYIRSNLISINLRFLPTYAKMLDGLVLLSLAGSALGQQLPAGFNSSRWSWVSNEDPTLAVIPGDFNRTVFDAPWAANVSDQGVAAT
jgi:hypothetical protein